MRKSGKTTRTIDDAIQALFEKGEIRVPSHHELERVDGLRGYKVTNVIDVDWYKSSKVQNDLLQRILMRLDVERTSITVRA